MNLISIGITIGAIGCCSFPTIEETGKVACKAMAIPPKIRLLDICIYHEHEIIVFGLCHAPYDVLVSATLVTTIMDGGIWLPP